MHWSDNKKLSPWVDITYHRLKLFIYIYIYIKYGVIRILLVKTKHIVKPTFMVNSWINQHHIHGQPMNQPTTTKLKIRLISYSIFSTIFFFRDNYNMLLTYSSNHFLPVPQALYAWRGINSATRPLASQPIIIIRKITCKQILKKIM